MNSIHVPQMSEERRLNFRAVAFLLAAGAAVAVTTAFVWSSALSDGPFNQGIYYAGMALITVTIVASIRTTIRSNKNDRAMDSYVSECVAVLTGAEPVAASIGVDRLTSEPKAVLMRSVDGTFSQWHFARDFRNDRVVFGPVG